MKVTMETQLKDICFFNNFSASHFNATPNSFQIDNTLLNKNTDLINSELNKDKFDNLIFFGDYTCENILHKNIIHIDFPSDRNDSNENQYFELLDNWAFTTENIYNKFKNTDNFFIITTEYLSTLKDPRPLLLALKKLFLFENFYNKLILIHTDVNIGYRTWNKKHIQKFFSASGFEYTTISDNENQLILSINSSIHNYKIYLEKQNIAKDLIDAYLLVLTTEDASITPTGGIGTYIKNMKNLSKKIAVLYCDLTQDPLNGYTNTFFIKSFISNINSENYFNGIGLIENIKSILYILPNLTTIEFQDYAWEQQSYTPLGFRVTQAKQTGILPNYLYLRAFLHGNIDHIKYGERDDKAMNYSFNELKLSAMDHYTFKHVDEVFSPSKYLQSLLENEYDYQLSNVSIQRLPFDLNDLGEIPKTNISEITDIVFIGKYIPLKGWPDFLEAINILSKKESFKKIKKITALSPGNPSANDLEQISEIINFKSLHLTHTELMQFIKNHKNHTLFIVPSAGESFSFVTLELLLTGALFVGYNAGGAVEVVDNDVYISKYFCEPNTMSLADKILQILNLNHMEHNDYLNKNQMLFYNKQKSINAILKKTIEKKFKSINEKTLEFKNISKEISIVIPVYNTDFKYIKDLIFSINTLRIRPNEIIFIDDGSQELYINHLTLLIQNSISNMSFRIISYANAGLAASRNRGLNESKTKYTYFMDSDDVFIPNTLYNAWVCMQISPHLVATSGFPLDFANDELRNISLINISNGDYWKPIGHSMAKALSMKENHYIAASSFINTQIIKCFGGWDDSDKSTWEDWAFYSRLAWSGYEFSLMPTIGYFYRNTPHSMSKTYNKFFGRRRIIRNIPMFSKLDTNIIISLMNNQESPLKEKTVIQSLKRDLNACRIKYRESTSTITSLKKHTIKEQEKLTQIKKQLLLTKESLSYRLGHTLLHEKKKFMNPITIFRKIKILRKFYNEKRLKNKKSNPKT